MSTAIRTESLGKRFGAKWALRECSFDLPAGRICGLVGANGAGKTTLLRMLAGLSRPSTGLAEVATRTPADDAEFLAEVGYLAQEIPLYRRWTAADHLRMGAQLNPRWDDQAGRDRLRSLRIPLDQRIGTMSGGQRAQVGLALALAKRPRVLLLDEPVAALDPLARREFLSTLGEAAADGELTVILSSHLVTDLERVCDHLVVLADSRTVLAEDLDEVLSTHRLLTAPRRDTAAVERMHTVLRIERTQRQVNLWVRLNGPLHDPTWEATELSLEEIMLAYLGMTQPRPEAHVLSEVAG
ncbi:MAG TPA: ABC transporter ATP-binding protein [Jatrophihabitans sp.]|jgi:ABC-2 type transport system ATP-binding protein|nr:ABC transporter ATP-binding protein [Jatrophihabitans sp.]